ncbi:MAG: B12-binding domain-containing radical SAM protein [Promethearchaeota archaeon]
MNSQDILLVFPSGGNLYFTHFSHNLGSGYIIAYLKKHSFNAKQFISKESYNVKECVKKIMEYNPKIVGFTVYETNFMQCSLISNGLKAYNPDTTIIFGGPTPSVQSKEILEGIRSVDLCVRREGEETVLELLTKLQKNDFKLDQTDLSDIKGLTYRKDNIIITNPDSNILLSNREIENYIDKYPSPYLSEIIPRSKAFPTGIITARGCNQNCVYCNCAVMSKRNLFLHSIKRVIDELAYINENKHFIHPVPINDDTFTLLPTRTKKICELIIENDLKIPLLCTTRCDSVTEELLDLMKQAGFVSIGFSLESAVPRVLKTIGKVSPPGNSHSRTYEKEIDFIQKLKHMTSYAKNIGFRKVFVSIMVGLPGETMKDAQKTIDYVKKLDIDFYTHNLFHIFKGTPIYQDHKKYNYIIKPMGKKNKILLQNNFPFDVYRITLTPKCAEIQVDEILDYETLKIMSLVTLRTKQKNFFDNIIINTDIIKPSTVEWIQENLRLNGPIIHLYTNKVNYLKLHEKNRMILFNELSPSQYYESYYWNQLNEASILKAGRMALYDEYFGIPITIKNTHMAIEEYKKGHDKMQYFIGKDKSPFDTNTFHNFLIEISKKEDKSSYLMKSNPLPQFQQLCRWTKTQGNCQTLETAIIENDDSIKICWYSDPIGNTENSFSEIKLNINRLQKKNKELRICKECKENKNCIQCLFPKPLSTDKYCKYIRSYNTNEVATIIDGFNIVKDFLFKPINPFDF